MRLVLFRAISVHSLAVSYQIAEDCFPFHNSDPLARGIQNRSLRQYRPEIDTLFLGL